MVAGHSPSAVSSRRSRLSAGEVRERMLQAAQEMVMETGVSISLEEMSLEDVMRRAQVPRSSVYRLWPYKGGFVDELLCRLAQPDWAGTAQPVKQQRALDVAWGVVNANRARLATEEGRRSVLHETVRLAVDASFHDMIADPAWPVYVALASTIGSVRDPRARADIARALEDFERQRVDSLVGFFERIVEALGFRLRDGFQFEHLVVATGSMMQGLLLRSLIVRSAQEAEPRTASAAGWDLGQVVDGPVSRPGLDGWKSEWHLVAIAYLGIMEMIIEIDPDADVLPEGI